MIPSDASSRVTAFDTLAFDNPNLDAIGLMTRIGADGEPISSGLQINQAVPSHVKVLDAAKQATRRIAVHNQHNNAEILLADASGTMTRSCNPVCVSAAPRSSLSAAE
mgnify:CR=1 FL=1